MYLCILQKDKNLLKQQSREGLVAMMVEWEDPELTYSHGHTQITTIYRETIYETFCGAQQHTRLWSPELYALGMPSTQAVAGLSTVGALVGGTGPQPDWLSCPASCGGCQPMCGKG